MHRRLHGVLIGSGMFIASLCAASAAHAQPSTLSHDVLAAIRAAKSTGNQVVIEATARSLMQSHPAFANDIALLAGCCQPVATRRNAVPVLAAVPVAPSAPSAPLAVQTAKAAKPDDKRRFGGFTFDGEVELGAEFSRGNTEEQTAMLATKITAERDEWKHTIGGKARNNVQDDTRTAEEYRLNWQSDYALSEQNYLFGAAEYVNDRFSGYQYRVNETLGYGHYLIKNETMEWAGEVGGGARHSKEINATKTEHDPTMLVRSKFHWNINDNWEFDNTVQSVIGRELVVSEFDAALSSSITDAMKLKLRYNLEHVDDAPAGKKHTDSYSSVNLVHDF